MFLCFRAGNLREDRQTMNNAELFKKRLQRLQTFYMQKVDSYHKSVPHQSIKKKHSFILLSLQFNLFFSCKSLRFDDDQKRAYLSIYQSGIIL